MLRPLLLLITKFWKNSCASSSLLFSVQSGKNSDSLGHRPRIKWIARTYQRCIPLVDPRSLGCRPSTPFLDPDDPDFWQLWSQPHRQMALNRGAGELARVEGRRRGDVYLIPNLCALHKLVL
jgi:hypothetical protein